MMDETSRGRVDEAPERLIDRVTLATIERELAKLCSHGFGQLTIVVEHGQLKELQVLAKVRL